MLRHEVLSEFRFYAIPDGAVNYALASQGATAEASSCRWDEILDDESWKRCSYSPGRFSAAGVINENRTLKGWGCGNGWQDDTQAWYPDWIVVRFPKPTCIDTVIIYTFPEHVRGRNKFGIRDYQLHLQIAGQWIVQDDVRNNSAGQRIHSFPAREVEAIRVWVMAANTDAEVSGRIKPADHTRLLEIEAYHLGGPVTEIREEQIITIEQGQLGSVAIFREPLAAGAGSADPEYLAHVLRQPGYGVTFLDARALTDPQVLSPDNFHLFIHPYGPRFPLGTALYDYLERGGHLITIGGKAFTDALQWDNGKLVATGYDMGLIADDVVPRQDHWAPLREQLGLFAAPGHELKDVVRVATPPDQIAQFGAIDFAVEVEGHSAAGLVGAMLTLEEDQAIWEAGRPTGHWTPMREAIKRERPRYHGENVFDEWPPFATSVATWQPLLMGYDRCGRPRGTVAALLQHYEGRYKGSIWAAFAASNVDLFQVAPAAMDALLLRIVDRMRHAVIMHHTGARYSCYRQGEAAELQTFIDNYGHNTLDGILTLEVLSEASGELVHRLELPVHLAPGSWEKVVRPWLPQHYETDFYIVQATVTVDGHLVAQDKGGFVVWDETVLAKGPHIEFRDNLFWLNGRRRHILGSRESGLSLPSRPGENPLDILERYRLMRDMGMAVASPIFFSIFVPGFGCSKEMPGFVPEEVIRQLDAHVQLAQKCGLVLAPNLFFLTKVESMIEIDLSQRLAAMLGKRYANVPGLFFYLVDDQGRYIPPHVFIPWAEAVMRALRSAGRDFLVTTEIDARHNNMDGLHTCALYLSFASASDYGGFTGSTDTVAACITDMRIAGKSNSMAEFGCQAANGRDKDHLLHLIIPHQYFGLGFCMTLNWKWQDDMYQIWPWGLIFPCDWVPKEHAYTYRNQALLFGLFHPRVEIPPTVIVLPRGHWLGCNNGKRHLERVVWIMREMTESHLPFAVVDEAQLERLPPTTRLLIYPQFSTTTEQDIMIVQERIQAGTLLMLTDTPVPSRYPRWYMAPYERERFVAALQQVLAREGIHPINLQPKRRDVHVMRLACDEGQTFVLVPDARGEWYYDVREWDHSRKDLTLTHDGHTLAFTLAEYSTGLFTLTLDGKLIAAEAQGDVALDGQPICRFRGHAMLYALDGADLRQSEAILILPIRPGEVALYTKNDWLMVGTPHNGQWHNHESLGIQDQDGWKHVTLDADRTRSLLVLTTERKKSQAIALFEHRIARGEGR